MPDLAVFPNVEQAVVELLSDIFGDGAVGVVTPSNLADYGGYARVVRSGGSDDRISDTSRVDIDVFAANRSDAVNFAEQVRQRLLSWPHTLPITDCVIDRVETNLSPSVVPWSNTNLALVTATYAVTARRPS